MELIELCAGIRLPEAVIECVLKFAEDVGFGQYRAEIEGLKAFKTSAAAAIKLECGFAGADSCGVLACMLQCAAEVFATYRKRKIPDMVYWNTMQCFTRFINERFAATGEYKFDRSWWAWRQLCMRLFRIGALEYELGEAKGRPAIFMHIPSDANFEKEACDSSIGNAKAFLSEFFPRYVGCRFYCESWLLSPALLPMLHGDSNIIRFQKRFVIEEQDPDDLSYRYFVFRRADGEIAAYPETTSLQKNIKKFLLQGGKVGAARGYLVF